MTDKNGETVRLDLDLLYAVTQSQSTNDLCAAAERFCAAQEFKFWIYGLASPDKALTNYPAALVASYTKNGWHRGCDPVINAMNRQRRSVSWDVGEAPLCDERRGAGACAGVSAPVCGRGRDLFD